MTSNVARTFARSSSMANYRLIGPIRAEIIDRVTGEGIDLSDVIDLALDFTLNEAEPQFEVSRALLRVPAPVTITINWLEPENRRN